MEVWGVRFRSRRSVGFWIDLVPKVERVGVRCSGIRPYQRTNQATKDDSMKAAKEIPALTEKDKERFWSKVDKNGPLPDQSNPHYAGLDRCWVWTAGLTSDGYGRFSVGRGTFNTHRLSFVMLGGTLDSNSPHVLHRCDFPSCVNPLHLMSGTIAENMADKVKKGRCARGESISKGMRYDQVCRGEQHSGSKLTESDVVAIRSRYETGGMQLWKIAAEFNVSRPMVARIIRRRNWKHVA